MHMGTIEHSSIMMVRFLLQRLLPTKVWSKWRMVLGAAFGTVEVCNCNVGDSHANDFVPYLLQLRP